MSYKRIIKQQNKNKNKEHNPLNNFHWVENNASHLNFNTENQENLFIHFVNLIQLIMYER